MSYLHRPNKIKLSFFASVLTLYKTFQQVKRAKIPTNTFFASVLMLHKMFQQVNRPKKAIELCFASVLMAPSLVVLPILLCPIQVLSLVEKISKRRQQLPSPNKQPDAEYVLASTNYHHQNKQPEEEYVLEITVGGLA
jgi:hypothetical protein